MYSPRQMLRATAPYLAAALAVSSVAAAAYGGGAIGVPLVYAALVTGCLIGLVGYVRWDDRQHPRH